MGDGLNFVTVSSAGHHEALVTSLWQAMSLKQLLDLDATAVGWGDRTVRVHRLVADVFLSPDKYWRTSDSDSCLVKPELESMVEFMYRGIVTVREEQLDGLLQVAKEFEFGMLVDAIDSVRLAPQVAVSEMVSNNFGVCRKRISNVESDRRRKRLPDVSTSSSKAISHDTNASVGLHEQSSSGIVGKQLRQSARHSAAKKLSETAAPSTRTTIKSATESQATQKRFKILEIRNTTRGKISQTNQVDACSRLSASSDQSGSDDSSVDRKKASRRGRIGNKVAKKRAGDRSKVSDVAARFGHGKHDSTTAGPVQPFLRCEYCEFKTRSKLQAALHRAQHDPDVVVFPCTECEKKFLDQSALERHKSVHTDNPKLRHRCQFCDYKTGSLSRFQVHQSIHDSNIEIVKCKYCTKKFTDSEPLSRHKCVRMSGANLYCCPHCDYRTAHRVRHQVHLARKHDASIDVFRCPTCRRPFLSQQLLGQHRCKRLGTAAPVHPCTECKFKTTCASQLRYHVLAVHSVEKPYKCELAGCGYATGSKTCLKRHWAVQHLDIKKFICEDCGHRCVTHQQLKNHRNTHTGEKPLRCDECGATFAHAYTWKRHVQRHVSDFCAQYICDVCGTAFNRRDNLRVHLRNVHKTEMSQPSGKQ